MASVIMTKLGQIHEAIVTMSVTVFDAYIVSDLVKETVPTSTLPFSTGADLEVGSDGGGA